MKNALADYIKKFSFLPQDKQRPTSAIFPKRSSKKNTLESSHRINANQSCFENLTSRNLKPKRSRRNLSVNDYENQGKSSIVFQPSRKKTSEYRYQMINSRCMKKIPEISSSNTFNIGENKINLGSEIKIMSRAERKEFIGKRLKCLRKNTEKRVKT